MAKTPKTVDFSTIRDTFLTAVLGETEIGSTVDGRFYTIDPRKMTAEALAHVLRYGFQRFVNDGTGGADRTASQKVELATAKVAKLYADPFVLRTRGLGEPEINQFIRQVVRAKLLAESKIAYNALEPDAREDWLMAKFDNAADATKAAISAKAEELLAADRAFKAEKAKLTGEVEVQL